MSQPSGTITPFDGSHQIGLDITETAVVKLVQKRAFTKVRSLFFAPSQTLPV